MKVKVFAIPWGRGGGGGGGGGEMLQMTGALQESNQRGHCISHTIVTLTGLYNQEA